MPRGSAPKFVPASSDIVESLERIDNILKELQLPGPSTATRAWYATEPEALADDLASIRLRVHMKDEQVDERE